MINIFNNFKHTLFFALKDVGRENSVKVDEKSFYDFNVEPSKDKAHGDLACNIAMIFSKKFSHILELNNPRKLADKIIEKILSEQKKNHIAKLEIAGPGFINIFLENEIFYEILADLLTVKKFTFENFGNDEKINLEYASPNPTGPMHVGHTRGAIYGDVLANLLSKTGFDVLKEYYINDAGSQINTLVRSAYLRYLQASGMDVEISEGLYPGEYLIPIGKKLYDKYPSPNLLPQGDAALNEIRDFVVDEMLKLIISDLEALGIKHDNYFSEKKELHDTGKIEIAIQALRNKGLIYEGKLEKPKKDEIEGASNPLIASFDDTNSDEKLQVIFRSTLFGDDIDRVVKKADGSPTYLAGDMAYTISKFERGATKFIMPLGYDHSGYVKRLSAVVDVLTESKASVKVILCQMVKFMKNGEPLKMSKRAGNFISAREVVDEIGADALRFIMLTRKNDAPFDFDLARVIEQTKDNPIFYVQYAHTRCCSVLRNLRAAGVLQNIENDKINAEVLKNLIDENEIELLKKIISFPRVVEMSVSSLEPHRIAFYLQELAAIFHSLWNSGMENPDLKFIIPQKLDITKARIYLIMATRIIIQTGLGIFNIKALSEMR
jgi:arginyl-tRNA synthetase